MYSFLRYIYQHRMHCRSCFDWTSIIDFSDRFSFPHYGLPAWVQRVCLWQIAHEDSWKQRCRWGSRSGPQSRCRTTHDCPAGASRSWKQSILCINTLRPRQNGRRFADDTFKRIFLNENVRISIKISPKFVPKGPINNNPALVQIMAWRRSGDKPLSEPIMVSLLTHICITRPQWVNGVVQDCGNFCDAARYWYILPIFAGLLHCHWGNHMIAPVAVKQPWRMWANESPDCPRSPDITCQWCM